MSASRSIKQEQVAALRDSFDRAVATVLLDFRGVDVEKITDLRGRFRKAGVEYKVVKNNLVRKALADNELAANPSLDEHLRGMTGVAWSYEDPSAAAKIIKEFRKEHAGDLAKKDEPEKLTVKCGLLEGELLDARQVETELASLPGKDELRAMLLAQLQAPAQNLVRQLQAPGQNLALVLEAYRRENQG